MSDDLKLLQQFARSGDEEPFREVVTRRFDLVYSAALRQVNGDQHLAEDIAQMVFADLARRAGSLSSKVVITGWLYEATRFAAAKALRREGRRRIREQHATTMMHGAAEDCSPDWERLRPVLDSAIGELKASDRDAILLRYFERKDLHAVGAVLGLNEDAAQKRIARALEKLREALIRRGVTSPVSALAAAISEGGVHSAAAGLAATAATASLVTSRVTSGFVAQLQAFGATKLKVAAAALVAAAVTVPVFIRHRTIEALRTENTALRNELSQLTAGPKTAEADSVKEDAQRALSERAELLRLRGQVASLRQVQNELATTKTERDHLARRLEEVTVPRPLPDVLVSRIVITGNVAFTEAQLASVMASKVGEPLERSRIDQDIRAIYKTYRDAGYRFSNVRCAEDRAHRTLTFVVQEAQQ